MHPQDKILWSLWRTLGLRHLFLHTTLGQSWTTDYPSCPTLLNWLGHAGFFFTIWEGLVHFYPRRPLGCLSGSLRRDYCGGLTPGRFTRLHHPSPEADLGCSCMTCHQPPTPHHCDTPSTGFSAKNGSHPVLPHFSFEALALLNWTHHPSKHKLDLHEDYFLSWHPGGGKNFPWLSKSLAVFKPRLKTYHFTKHFDQLLFKIKHCVFSFHTVLTSPTGF